MTMSDLTDAWRWNPEMAARLRFPFEGAAAIAENYSQAWQDIFVLSLLGGRRDGRYLEIGGHLPVENNNTYLLHRFYGWQGMTLEIDPAHFPHWLRQRPDSGLVIADALFVDYADAIPRWFGAGTKRLDYLQLDIEPSLNTLKVLQKMPLDACRFSVIHFETDAYTRDFAARNESRKILKARGYELVARDVCVLYPPVSATPVPFEDWWVDPTVVDKSRIDEMLRIRDSVLLPQNILFRSA